MSDETSPSSSGDMHPHSGARFVFTRDEAAESLRYELIVYLPESRAWEAVLRWEDGRPSLGPSVGLEPDDAWTLDMAMALAKLLKRDPKRKLIRWRARR